MVCARGVFSSNYFWHSTFSFWFWTRRAAQVTEHPLPPCPYPLQHCDCGAVSAGVAVVGHSELSADHSTYLRAGAFLGWVARARETLGAETRHRRTQPGLRAQWLPIFSFSSSKKMAFMQNDLIGVLESTQGKRFNNYPYSEILCWTFSWLLFLNCCQY